MEEYYKYSDQASERYWIEQMVITYRSRALVRSPTPNEALGTQLDTFATPGIVVLVSVWDRYCATRCNRT